MTDTGSYFYLVATMGNHRYACEADRVTACSWGSIRRAVLLEPGPLPMLHAYIDAADVLQSQITAILINQTLGNTF